MRWMADVRATENCVREASHCDHAPRTYELSEERPPCIDLARGRAPVRVDAAGQVRVRRYQIPEQHVIFEAELTEHAVDDRCRGLGGITAGQLTLGRERDAADPRAAIPRGLADEDEPGPSAAVEVRRQALAPESAPAP